MTYQDIISQIALKLGHTGFSSELKANYRYAVMFAEQSLFQVADILRRDVTLPLNSNTESYDLPNDYNEPCEFIFKDSAGGILSSVNVTRSEFMTIRVNSQDNTLSPDNEIIYAEKEVANVQSDARYKNRLVYSIDFQDGVYKLYVKPKIVGVADLYFAAVPVQDVYQNLKREPILPAQYHIYIIYGAVAYLAESEATKALQTGDYPKANFYSKLAKETSIKFESQQKVVTANSAVQPKPQILKPWNWYENPRATR